MATKRADPRGKKRPPTRSGIGKGRRARVIELYLGGTRPHEIARTLKVSPSVITETLKLAEVREVIDRENEAIRRRASDRRGRIVDEATDTLIALMRGEPDEAGRPTVSDAVRRQSASDLLDRFGLPKDANLNVTGKVAVGILDLARMTPEQIREVRALAWGELPGPYDDGAGVLHLPETPEAK